MCIFSKEARVPQCLTSVRPLFVPVLTSRVVSLFLPGGLPPSLPFSRTAAAVAGLVRLPPLVPIFPTVTVQQGKRVLPVPLVASSGNATVSTTTPLPVQAGRVALRRRFQKGTLIIRGKKPTRCGIYREDVAIRWNIQAGAAVCCSWSGQQFIGRCSVEVVSAVS